MWGAAGSGVAAAQALSLLFSAAFLTYWVGILVCYLRRRESLPGDAGAWEWHLFVPCLDEAAVIGDTLAYLRSTFPDAVVWVLDDDSADATAAIVAGVAARDPMVRLIQRRRPDARVGKGEALNAAYRELRRSLPAGADASQVIVGVVDADGRPSPGCLDAVAGDDFFGDPAVGGVQVEVRIANRSERSPVPARGRVLNLFGRTLVRMQDLEFRSVIGAIQTSRGRTRTVGMGGNGQFTRLSALTSLDDGDGRAWRGSLLEDYELGLHLMLAGHRTAFCADAWVDQEGLPDLGRYLTQRTRWGQGVMQCMRYLPRAWNSPNLTTAGAIETSYYLLQPWLSLLGTIVFPIPVLAVLVSQHRAHASLVTFLQGGGWVLALMYLVVGTTPFWMWGPLYRRRCEPAAGRAAALGWGFAYLVYVYGFYVTSWRAFARIVRGQRSWSKTRRNAEFAPTVTPAVPHVAPTVALAACAGTPRRAHLLRAPAPVPTRPAIARERAFAWPVLDQRVIESRVLARRRCEAVVSAELRSACARRVAQPGARARSRPRTAVRSVGVPVQRRHAPRAVYGTVHTAARPPPRIACVVRSWPQLAVGAGGNDPPCCGPVAPAFAGARAGRQ